MLRIIVASLLLSSATVVMAMSAVVDAGGESSPVTKSARLMKNREDIDVQSNYHEDEIKETGSVPDDHAARLVRNRGPITAKITASGRRVRGDRCSDDDKVKGEGGGDGDESCSLRFSLVAWKFAGDDGTVRGIMEEQSEDGAGGDRRGLTVDVDCMARDGKSAIVGGAVREVGKGALGGRRAYVRVSDEGDGGGDFISNVFFDDDINSNCRAPGVEEDLASYESDVVGSLVSVCSKHGDWEACLLKKARIEEAIAKVDRAIE